MNKKKSRRSLEPDRLPFLPPLAAHALRLLHASCRFTILGREHLDMTFNFRKPVLFTTWHFAFPAVIYFFRNRDGMLMVSRSRDGEWISHILKHLGFQTARGSAGKGGSSALRQMLSYIQSGHQIGLIADGSQGPARIAQKGILLLARHSGAPLIPVSMAAHPCWRFPSWDRTVLAKPFSHVVMAAGAPLHVDRQASSEELESLRKELENRLNELTRQARSKAVSSEQ